MSFSEDVNQLVREHALLLRRYGELQRRWADLMQGKTQEVARLQTHLMRLRAMLILQGPLMAWEREDRALARDTSLAPNRGQLITCEASPIAPEWAQHWLHHGLLAVDLVLCQTGCVSHDDFWRDGDDCKRLGQTCVRVNHPDAVPLTAPRTAAGDTP